MKEDPGISAFSLTLKPEEGGEPARIALPAWGETQRKSLAHPRHERAALASGESGESRSASGTAGATVGPLCWAVDNGCEDARVMVGKGAFIAAGLPGALGTSLGVELLPFPPNFRQGGFSRCLG